jgi:N-acetylglucosamine-6-phosphate deacetylase
MASLTPAELTGLARKTGSLEVGKQADLLLLNRKLEVRGVYLAGEVFVP